MGYIQKLLPVRNTSMLCCVFWVWLLINKKTHEIPWGLCDGSLSCCLKFPEQQNVKWRKGDEKTGSRGSNNTNKLRVAVMVSQKSRSFAYEVQSRVGASDDNIMIVFALTCSNACLHRNKLNTLVLALMHGDVQTALGMMIYVEPKIHTFQINMPSINQTHTTMCKG